MKSREIICTTVSWEYLVRAMPFRLLGTTIMLGAITGFVELSKGAFFRTLGGQIVQGVLSIACFILVGIAFLRFGWKIGLLDLLLVIIASNVGLALHRVRLPPRLFQALNGRSNITEK